MSVYKIIKENVLKIPIGTKLHYTSFFDKPKKFKRLWDSISVYNYQDNDGKLHCINGQQFSLLKDCYVNCIVASWTLEFLYEGDKYWKVFTSEKEAQFHKLEFDGKKHLPALLFKPYKDIVYNNTNFNCVGGIQRFSSLELAEKYCHAVKNNINFHNIIENL